MEKQVTNLEKPVTIGVINQKGGVGKTETCINLAYSLSQLGHETLLLDIDPQSNLSRIFFHDDIYDEETGTGHRTVADLFYNKKMNIANCIKGASVKYNGEINPVDNLFICPSDSRLGPAGDAVVGGVHKEKILKNHIKRLGDDAPEFVILDCPPSLSILTTNAVFASDLLLIPTTDEIDSFEGISKLLTGAMEIKETEDLEDINFRIFINKRDPRKRSTTGVLDSYLENYSRFLFSTIINVSEPLNQARILKSIPQLAFKKSRSNEQYNELAKELITNVS